MKRLFVLLLAVCMLVSAMSLTACSNDKKEAKQSDEEIIKSMIAENSFESPIAMDDSSGISYNLNCEADGSALVLKYVSKTELTQEQVKSETDRLTTQAGNAFNDVQMRGIVDKLKGKGISKPTIKINFCNSDGSVFFSHVYDAKES